MGDVSASVNSEYTRSLDIPNGKRHPVDDGIGNSFAASYTSLYSNAYSHGTFGSVSSGSLAMYQHDSGSSQALLNAQSVERLFNGTYEDVEHTSYYGSQERSQLVNNDTVVGEWNDDTGSFLEESVDDTVVLSGGDPFSSDYPQSPIYVTSDTEQYYSDLRERRHRTYTQRKSFCQGRASTSLIAWNVINMITSLSILALPFAISRGGLVTVGIIPFIALITLYTGNLVVDCTYSQGVSTRNPNARVRVRADYTELGQDSTNSKLGGFLISMLEVSEMLSTCCLNVSVLGALCHEILPSFDVRICTVIGGSVALPTFFIRRLTIIGWMQTISILSLGVGMILVEGYCFSNFQKWTLTNIALYDLKNLPVSVGIILFAFGVHHILPGIEQQMAKPKQFGRMLFSAKLVASIIFCLFGLTNALLYGSHTDQVITVDLQNHFGLGVSAAVFIFISVLCMFALPSFVVMDRLDHALSAAFPSLNKNNESTSLCISVSVRFIVVSISIIVAVFLPCFGLLMAFFGSTISSVLCIILPCWFHMKIKGDSISKFNYFTDIVVLLLGLLIFCSGSYYSCKAMVRYFNITGR